MDHHVERASTTGLRARGVDVLTAYEDGGDRLPDPDLLDRATALNRVLFTRDSDLLVEARYRQQQGIAFVGVIYARKRHVSTGRCVQDLELIAKVADSHDLQSKVQYLPI